MDVLMDEGGRKTESVEEVVANLMYHHVFCVIKSSDWLSMVPTMLTVVSLKNESAGAL